MGKIKAIITTKGERVTLGKNQFFVKRGKRVELWQDSPLRRVRMFYPIWIIEE